jgi:hypothetical protein
VQNLCLKKVRNFDGASEIDAYFFGQFDGRAGWSIAPGKEMFAYENQVVKSLQPVFYQVIDVISVLLADRVQEL